MQRTLHSALLAAVLGLGGVAAQAETVGIGDDTLELLYPDAAEQRPDVTRERGTNTGAPFIGNRDTGKAPGADQDTDLGTVEQIRRYDHL